MRQIKKAALRSGVAALGCAIVFASASLSNAVGAPPTSVEFCSPYLAQNSMQIATPSAFQSAFDHVVESSPDPERARSLLLMRLRAGMGCYPGDLTQAEYENLITTTALLPPAMGPLNTQPRFYYDAYCWLGAAGQGPANTSRPASLTYSFPADGTTWGLTCSTVGLTGPNTLGASLISTFGTIDKGHEYMRQSLAAWRRVGALTYQEVADDGSAEDTSIVHVSTRGDIRMGGFALGISGQPLAYDAFPSNQGFSICAGSDMFINTSYFTPVYFNFAIPASMPYRLFRNTVAHEHGHGLGFKHTVPCNATKLMEPVINTTVEMLTSDDVRAAITNYGDRFTPNHSFFSPHDFGTLDSPAVRSVYELDLGVNGPTVLVNNVATAEDDYFRFTLTTSQAVGITITPTGVLLSQIQSDACSATPTTPINGQQAGHLGVQLLNSSQTVIASSTAAAVGSPQVITTQTLAPGTYSVRVWDQGDAPNASVNQVVQTYNLLIRVGSSFAPPQAIAGVSKIARANQPTWFMGDYSSRATDTGATIPSGNYDWDLDGDGVFETLGVGEPSITYVSNGVYNVTLRVTDSNGMINTDTITCTVSGATTTVTSLLPTSGLQGTTVPVTISGTNLRNVNSLSQISISASGVTLSGTPVPNALGTQVTGVSLVIASNAPSGSCNMTISNSDGTGTGTNVFTVGPPTAQGACCTSAGACSTVPASQCQGAGQTYLGDNTLCSPNPCPQPGACCGSLGACSLVLPSACTGSGNTFQVGVCSPNPCPQPGACCSNTGTCTYELAPACAAASGAFQTGACFPNNPCPQLGSCCAPDGSCTYVLQAACTASGSTFQAGTCTPTNACPQPGSCCSGTGTCTFVVQGSCSGAFQAGVCSPNPCAQPSAACCFGNGTCTLVTQVQCQASGGVYQGAGVSCSLNLCTPLQGACCAGSTCSLTTSTGCTGANRRFVGNGTACNAAGNSTTPCCKADFNQSSATGTGGVNVQDIFAFLAAWFSKDPTADFDGSGTITVQDIFSFLAAWFTGC